MKDVILWPFRAIRYAYRDARWKSQVRTAIYNSDTKALSRLANERKTKVRWKP